MSRTTGPRFCLTSFHVKTPDVPDSLVARIRPRAWVSTPKGGWSTLCVEGTDADLDEARAVGSDLSRDLAAPAVTLHRTRDHVNLCLHEAGTRAAEYDSRHPREFAPLDALLRHATAGTTTERLEAVLLRLELPPDAAEVTGDALLSGVLTTAQGLGPALAAQVAAEAHKAAARLQQERFSERLVSAIARLLGIDATRACLGYRWFQDDCEHPPSGPAADFLAEFRHVGARRTRRRR